MIRSSIRCLILIMICSLARIAPAYSQTAVPLPEIRTERLLNGLQVIVAPTPYLGRNMAIGLVVRYGSAFDAADKSGLAHFLSRMFVKATADKTGGTIQDELALLGATLEVQSDWDGFRFLLKGNSATFERSLLLLYQVVCEAQFPENELNEVKQEILEKLQQVPDTRTRLRDLFETILFRGTTYGRAIEGTPDTARSISAGDLRYFYNKHFSPNAASLVLAGDVDPSLVLEKAARIWGLWIQKDPIPFTFAPSREPAEDIHLIEDDPGSSAVEFILGNFSPQRQDPQYINTRLATQILQQRLRKLLPTSLLTVSLDSRRMPGALYIEGQAAAAESIDQIAEIEESLETMKTELVEAGELAEAQNKILRDFSDTLKTADGVCNIILDTELYRLGSHYMATFPDHIRDCDADDVRQAARQYFFPGKKIVLLKGPVQVLLPDLKRLGTFQRLVR